MSSKRLLLQHLLHLLLLLTTIALGENSVVNADKDGIPVSVTLAGANGTGTIQLHMTYVVD